MEKNKRLIKMWIIIDNNSKFFEHNYLESFRIIDKSIKKNIDDNKKIFLLNPPINVWHFICDFLGQILEIGENEDYDKCKFIIKFDIDDDSSHNLILFLKDFFNKINLKNYHFFMPGDLIGHNEYYNISPMRETSKAMYNKIYEVFLKNYPTEIVKPEKMIYVSRRNASIDRIDDEKKIESFFENLGFEILFRGNFGEKDLVEDIKYFREVKVIAGLSGAGLTNSIFMPPGGLVIEISVPQITHVENQEEHDLFPEIRVTARHLFHPASSFIKDHTHIQIPVNDNSAETAINKIKRLGIFR